MDLYAENEKALWKLREKIVDNIVDVLEEKGYHVGSKAEHYDKFEIMSDRLIINGYHTDNISTDNLLKHLRDAYHVLPKMN